MIIRNGNVVLKNSVEKKDLLIKDGKIVKIADMIPADGSQEIDANGKYVFPGLIDMHVHLRDPGYEYKEDIESGMIFRREGVPMGIPGLDEWHIQRTDKGSICAARIAVDA